VKNLTEGSEGRLIFQFTIPMLIGNVFQQLYNIVDSVIVGNALGKEALGAIGACIPIIFLFIALAIGLTVGITILISQYYGAQDFKSLKKAIDTGYFCLFLASIVILTAGLIFSEAFLRIMKTPAEIFPQAKIFLTIAFLSMPFVFGYNLISAILRGLGDSKTPLYFLILSTLLNIVLVSLFVLVFKWGIAGSAWATFIAQGVAFISGMIYLNRTHKMFHLDIKALSIDWKIFRASLKLGLPSGAQQMIVASGFAFVFRIINQFGADTTAAVTAASRIETFAIMPAMNFSMALSAFTGQNLGARKVERVKKGFRTTVVIASSVSLFVSILVILFGKLLIACFNSDANVVRIGYDYLWITGTSYILFSILLSANGVLIGAGLTAIPMISSFLSMWLVRIPLAIFLSGKMGVNGIWMALPIGWLAGCIFSVAFYLKGDWKKKTVVPLLLEAEEIREEKLIEPGIY
jgi:putative MATE family efflux protein